MAAKFQLKLAKSLGTQLNTMIGSFLIIEMAYPKKRSVWVFVWYCMTKKEEREKRRKIDFD